MNVKFWTFLVIPAFVMACGKTRVGSKIQKGGAGTAAVTSIGDVQLTDDDITNVDVNNNAGVKTQVKPNSTNNKNKKANGQDQDDQGNLKLKQCLSVPRLLKKLSEPKTANKVALVYMSDLDFSTGTEQFNKFNPLSKDDKGNGARVENFSSSKKVLKPVFENTTIREFPTYEAIADFFTSDEKAQIGCDSITLNLGGKSATGKIDKNFTTRSLTVRFDDNVTVQYVLNGPRLKVTSFKPLIQYNPTIDPNKNATVRIAYNVDLGAKSSQNLTISSSLATILTRSGSGPAELCQFMAENKTADVSLPAVTLDNAIKRLYADPSKQILCTGNSGESSSNTASAIKNSTALGEKL